MLHGTTVATNALVQLRGAKVGVITTRGHRDTLPVMRASGRARACRSTSCCTPRQQYRPEPIVTSELIAEVDERVDSAGQVVVALDEEGVDAARARAGRRRRQAIAVCFLWSVANPEHELRVREVVQEAAPDLYVTCSHQASARSGEYERFAAAAINAFIGPRARGLPHAPEAGPGGHRGSAGRSSSCRPAGGVAPDELRRALPILTIGSGPSAGVAASSVLADRRGEPNVIATDMGGTSFDVALIVGRAAGALAVDRGQPVRVLPPARRHPLDRRAAAAAILLATTPPRAPCGWAPRARAPTRARSATAAAASARPSPTRTSCSATSTRTRFLGGELQLDRDAAVAALEELGSTLDMDAVETALAARHIVEAQMADLIRQMTVERGMDPRDFALYAYGGAAGLHVEGYLRELGSERAIIPLGTLSTTWSAYGCATSDVIHVHERNLHLSSPFDAGALRSVLAELEQDARDELTSEGIPAERQAIERFVEMKYPLQIHRVEVPVAGGEIDDACGGGDRRALRRALRPALRQGLGLRGRGQRDRRRSRRGTRPAAPARGALDGGGRGWSVSPSARWSGQARTAPSSWRRAWCRRR